MLSQCNYANLNFSTQTVNSSTMSASILQMPTIPTANIVTHGPVHPTCDWRTIRHCPQFCSVCLNLSAASANSLLPRNDIHTTTLSNRIIEHDSELRKHASALHLDNAPWQFSARAVDVKNKADEGCKSCELLMKGVQLMAGEEQENKTWFEDKRIALEVAFCIGWVLRVNIARVDEVEDDEDDDMMGGFFGASGDSLLGGETLDRYEFYTSYDSRSPCSSIGTRMHFQDASSGGEDGSFAGGTATHVPINPESSETLQFVRHIVTDCDDRHACLGHIEDGVQVLPRRLIKVGKDEGDVSLVELKGIPSAVVENNGFIALSHCWGQNSAADWEHEAAKMGSIYNGAYLVIAATGSTDGDGGSFFPRPGYGVINGTAFHQSNTERHDWRVFVRRARKHSAFGWQATHHQTNRYTGLVQADPGIYAQYPLFTRAWCYQERMLGKRILHFTKSEIVFECLRSLNCECGAMKDFIEDPTLAPRRMLSSSSLEEAMADHVEDHAPASHPLKKSLSPIEEARDTLFWTWRQLAAEYSRKNITFKSDMLPALGGLASRWAALDNLTYCAGMWKEDILRSLLWRADEPDHGDPSEPYVAPTWSWLSVQSSVTWIEPAQAPTKYYVDIDLTRTECAKKGAFVFGALEAGYMFLTGTLARATMPKIGFVNVESLTIPGEQGAHQFFIADNTACCKEHLGGEVWILPYCTDTTNASTGDGYSRAMVLVAASAPVIDRQPSVVRDWEGGVYCRLGLMRTFEMSQWDEQRIWDRNRIAPTSFFIV
ncbi:hypothetical protein K491DRAFT_763197 [Lophiostoma macrostomum CBS 122681]|uniref:Heterokaryon incompatibility domain-containing protein n=1 Tax=Lophiostoma macrostomum CBS 122681 TaxID=1314788 RepID=A0A6A6SML7_9PLEO|nr:hypothetical protein K491DRAFT_763197 [Lophiostoma macrostomum CBS 122681]